MTLALRNHILGRLEAASAEPDPQIRQKEMNVVVVGSGPTGVEISGMLSDMKRDILAKDHPEIPALGTKPHIYLVERVAGGSFGNLILLAINLKFRWYPTD